MSDDLGLVLLLGAILLFVAGAVVGDETAKATGFDNCIKYHEKLSVVEANALCYKVVRGVK